MNRILLTTVLLVIAGCSISADKDTNSNQAGVAEAATGGAAAADPLDDSDCNLQTVLDPNKPGSPGNLIKSQRNPNGDSELAVLMRLFVEQLQDARLVVQAGQKAEPLFPSHRTMRCAWPTKPSDRDAGFDARAQGYLAAVRAFDANQDKDSYNAVILNCIACHQVSCGGVIDFIQTLRWE